MSAIDAGLEKSRSRNLGYFFDGALSRNPDKVCIIDLYGGKEREVTYAQLDARMNQVASMLARLGVKADRKKWPITRKPGWQARNRPLTHDLRSRAPGPIGRTIPVCR